jgi:hypothetical protein
MECNVWMLVYKFEARDADWQTEQIKEEIAEILYF